MGFLVRSGEKGKQWEIAALSRFTAQSSSVHAASSLPPDPIHASVIPLVDKITMLQSQLPLPQWPGGLQGSWPRLMGLLRSGPKHQCLCPMQGDELRRCRLLPYREFLAHDPSGWFLLSWAALLICSWQKKAKLSRILISSTHRLPRVASACPAWSTAWRRK